MSFNLLPKFVLRPREGKKRRKFNETVSPNFHFHSSLLNFSFFHTFESTSQCVWFPASPSALCRPEKSIKYEYLACVNIPHKRDADIYRSQAELGTFPRRHDKHSPKLIHKNCTKNDKHMKSFMIHTFSLSAYSLHKNFSRLNLQAIRSDSIGLIRISKFFWHFAWLSSFCRLVSIYFRLTFYISRSTQWLHIFHLATYSTSGRWCLSFECANDTKSEILLSAAMELLPLIMSKYVLFGTANTRRVWILWHRNLEWELVEMGKCSEKNLHRELFSLSAVAQHAFVSRW